MKTYLILFGLLFFTSIVSAQTRYYDVTKTFYEDGYTYQCKEVGMVYLYNKENKFTDAPQIDRYTGKPITIEENYREQLKDSPSSKKSRCIAIVNSCFSDAEKKRVKDDFFFVTMYIDPDNGSVAEVEFNFLHSDPFATIPVSVYRKIELALKKEIRFVPTEEGKRRNYILVFWKHYVKL